MKQWITINIWERKISWLKKLFEELFGCTNAVNAIYPSKEYGRERSRIVQIADAFKEKKNCPPVFLSASQAFDRV